MRILVVEDETSIRRFLKKSLEAEVFAVDEVEDGEAGSFAARTNDYDLVILDNLLPKKNGVQICREIRAMGKSVPILMLSVKSEVNTKVELLDAGADDYLVKPFSFEELLARVHALLRRPRQIQDEVLTIGDLTLDCRRHSVVRGRQAIVLTRKEFMLLEYLMKNAGNVLSRGMLMEHVWDMNADPFSNTIESHVLSLRRKIDLPGRAKLIHTVPGRGYKIDLDSKDA
jgi:two-component system, OmpR family, response regulator